MRVPFRDHVRRDGLAKVGFASKAEALVEAPSNQRAYRCRLCRQWHRFTVSQPDQRAGGNGAVLR